MADEPETTESAGEGVVEQGGEHETLGHLSERVDKLAGMLERFLEGGGGQQPAEPPDIKAEVQEAVRKVQDADRKKAEKAAEQQSIQDQIGEIKAKLETPPMEYRRVTQRMGWNTP